MSLKNGLTETLDELDDNIVQERVNFKEIVEILNHRGFGSLIMVGALLVILPTGAVPGVPALVGIYMFILCTQILFGRRYIWLPNFIMNLKVRKRHLQHAQRIARPYTKKVDSYLGKRMHFMTNDIIARMGALFCMALCAIIVIFGFIPLLPMIFALPILVFALALAVGDGLLMLLSFTFMSMIGILVPSLYYFGQLPF